MTLRIAMAAALAAVLAPLPLAAQTSPDWYRIDANAQGRTYFDRASLAANGDRFTGTAMVVYNETERTTGVKYSYIALEFDCGERVLRYLRFNQIRADGRALPPSEFPDNGAPHRGSPGTPNAALIGFACDAETRETAPRIADPLKDTL